MFFFILFLFLFFSEGGTGVLQERFFFSCPGRYPKLLAKLSIFFDSFLLQNWATNSFFLKHHSNLGFHLGENAHEPPTPLLPKKMNKKAKIHLKTHQKIRKIILKKVVPPGAPI